LNRISGAQKKSKNGPYFQTAYYDSFTMLHLLAPRTMLIMDIVTSTQDAITQDAASWAEWMALALVKARFMAYYPLVNVYIRLHNELEHHHAING